MRSTSHFNKIQAKAIAISNNRLVLWLLLCTFTLSFGLYVVLINQTVRNVARLQTLQGELSQYTSHIGELEFKYIMLRNDVTIDTAHELGFIDVNQTKFIPRPSLSSLQGPHSL